MNRDKVIELARKSGVGPSHPALTMREADIQAVEQLVALVEKETLERAAKVCDVSSCLHGDYEAAKEAKNLAKEIRNLKDNHGQD